MTGTHANRLLLDVAGPASAVETAFAVHLNRYQAADGREFRAPDAAPSVPRALAGRLTGVAGLSDAAVRHPHNVRLSAQPDLRPEMAGRPAAGTGPGGGLAPSDIKAAYNLSSVSLDGTGQTLALFELDGYAATDISAYESRFGLRSVPLQNVLVDGAAGTAGMNADEVTLDIELQIALAPGASKILVYETGPTDANTLDAYSRIAEDDQAKQISTSWGLDEPESAPSTLQAENPIFQQMAAQGQTIYAASGDYGAYDTGNRRDGLSVDDPASQPYVCGVGGTTLATSGAGGAYASETTWNSRSIANGASGGGISTVWAIPTWQESAITSASGDSTAMRNVPDVSLNADPNTGYAIYIQGAWQVYGGTSCAAPLWAGFTALVNQQRAAAGLAPLGQAAPVLYPLLSGARYGADFHDIANGSTNLYYSAVTGYDDATGLGTLNGANLLTDLAPSDAAHTHLLWDNTDGSAMLWSIATDGSHTANTFGAMTGWTARAIADGTDGRTRLLWTRTDGANIVWTVNATDGSYTSTPTFGPYSGWNVASLAVGLDNLTRLQWKHSPDGQSSVWTVAANGSITSTPGYGPYGGWTASALALGSDGFARLLWNSGSGGFSVWTLGSGSISSTPAYAPSGGWSASAIAGGPDTNARLLLSRTDGAIAVWTVTETGGITSTPLYGPISGWAAKGLAVGSDALSRVLWSRSDGMSSVWTIAADGSIVSTPGYGPYSGWSAVALSAEP